MNQITRCRVCKGEDLETVYELGEQYISGFWHVHPLTVENTKRYPLTLTYCHNCNLLQLLHSAPNELLYSRHYWYRSGTNETMRTALYSLVFTTLTESSAKNGIWLDIGANDGTLLSLVPHSWFRIGCEPAENLIPDLRQHCNRAITDFWSADRYHRITDKKADVITAAGMLYDLEDPNTFVADMKAVLAEDGVIVCQLMCLEHMLHNKDVGNICHEHLEYYSIRNLVDLFRRHDLHIYKVEGNSVNGGSSRVFATHLHNRAAVGDPYLVADDPTLEDIYWFVHDIQENRRKTVEFIQAEASKGHNIYVYGASTKGNVILQYYGLTDKEIVAAADRNPDKHGLVMAGSNIPIISEEEMRHSSVDYLFCLPYAFIEEFMEREESLVEDSMEWIVPFPEMHIARCIEDVIS